LLRKVHTGLNCDLAGLFFSVDQTEPLNQQPTFQMRERSSDVVFL
jgi:hypothetical protein